MKRLLMAVSLGASAWLTLATTALGCSTAGSTLSQVANRSSLIAVVDVIETSRDGLNVRVYVDEGIRGVKSGSTIVLGPEKSSPLFPDCWASFPVGHRAVIALAGRGNLDALTSFIWWEEGGYLVTASAIEGSPGTMAELIRGLKSEVLPSTDTDELDPAPTQSGSIWTIAFLGFVALSWFAWTIRERRLRGLESDSGDDPRRP